ncbi:kinase-like protein [Piedraia hortae CBS 480.64]|uniref:Kinase-like protein n=1 Tax=Piedraia hortae CBS 480.64 TaxID=1314780 RepID=A0A6A7C5T7_9PEZI|nr:kinase-like protein [Piedraia hortae CBS 480.64]
MFTKALSSLTSNISSNYTISPQPSSRSGPWRIFDAKRKQTGKAVSVFIFDPKTLHAPGLSLGGRSGVSSLKRTHDEAVERLRREASSLARLRHPSILELQEPVEETRNGGLMFVTEPVSASLASLLHEMDDGARVSRYVVDDRDGTRKLEMDELEIQKGLLQLGKGLEFLHESAGLVHANLTPDAVLINAKGDWKIGGLAFCGPSDQTSTSSMPSINLGEVLNYDSLLPLQLDYTSPDFVLDNNYNPSADMFSLGLLIISLYNHPHTSPIRTNGSLTAYKRIFTNSSSIPTQRNNFCLPTTHPLPPTLSTLLPRLITRRPAQRLTARQFQESPYFDNILVRTIRFLDALPTKTTSEKTTFLRGLPTLIPQFPVSVLSKKLLPTLLDETKDKSLLAPLLSNIFVILKILPEGRNNPFSTLILPKLVELFPGGRPPEETAAALILLLENTPTILPHTSGKQFHDSILPIILSSLDAGNPHGVVDAALATLPHILPVLDFGTVKLSLFPAVAGVFTKTSSMGVKIRCLEAFSRLLGEGGKPVILDRGVVKGRVIPLLRGIKTKEPGVMIAALGVLELVVEVVDADAEVLALEVMPVLWAMALGPLLDKAQFEKFVGLIGRVTDKVVGEQRRRLRGEERNGVEGESGFEELVSGRRRRRRDASRVDDTWGDEQAGGIEQVITPIAPPPMQWELPVRNTTTSTITGMGGTNVWQDENERDQHGSLI